jgi:TonB-dependent receptor
VQLSALGTASLDLGLDHSITALTLFNRNVSDETVFRSGKYEGSGYQEKWQLQWLARTLWFNQLFGDHRNLFGTRLRLRWTGFHAYGERDEPDRRTVAYGGMGPSRAWTEPADRIYSKLRQDDLGGTLSLRFPLWPEGWGTMGAWAQLSTRDFGVRRLRMLKNQQNQETQAYGLSAEEIFAPDRIGPWTEINEDDRPNDTYESRQTTYAAFAMLESPIFGRLSGTGGVRLEISSQEVASQSPFPELVGNTQKRTDRTDVDPLPGAALKYELTKGMLLRAAYGITVARPQIRELAPYQYYDFVRDRNIEGNPELKRTRIQNFDLRWEWFFGEGEIASVSTFYKTFKNPIELTVLDNLTGGAQFRNADSARNLGGELELRLGLARLARPLRNFFFESNLALVYSRIELSAADARAVRASRPLAGQSPYVANLALRFLEPNRGVTASLVYNVVGRRITDVATLVGDVIPPDTYESTFHSLDIVASAQLSKHLKLKAKVRNLLFQAKELTRGDFLILRVDPGISGSLGLAIGF